MPPRCGARGSVGVPVVDVVHMQVGVGQRLVTVRVRMRHLCQFLRRVIVLVVTIVLVGMLQPFVRVGVLVGVGGEQEGPTRHAAQSKAREWLNRLSEEQPRHPAEARTDRGRGDRRWPPAARARASPSS